MNQRFTLKQLYGLAYQWIEHKQQRGMDEKEANKLAPVILDFFEFVMKHKPKKPNQHSDVQSPQPVSPKK